MKESKQQLSQRKIRNGLRKQAASVRAVREKEIWNALKYGATTDADFFYAPHISITSGYRTLEQQFALQINKAFNLGYLAG